MRFAPDIVPDLGISVVLDVKPRQDVLSMFSRPGADSHEERILLLLFILSTVLNAKSRQSTHRVDRASVSVIGSAVASKVDQAGIEEVVSVVGSEIVSEVE